MSSTGYQILPASSRVWVYQSNQPLPDEAIAEAREQIQGFAQAWVSHNRALKAHGDLLFNRFLVLMVDESQAGASGCSIDSSVAFVKSFQATYGVDFFDRMRFSYRDEKGQVQTISSQEFAQAYQEGVINDQTKVFDTLVKDKAQFESTFEKPLSESWHARMV